MRTDELLKLSEVQGLLEFGEWEAANTLLDSTTCDTKVSYRALILRCAIYSHFGWWDRLQAIAEMLAEDYPEQWRPQYFLAQCAMHRGDAKDARRHFRYALKHARPSMRQHSLEDPLIEAIWRNIGQD